MAAAKYFIGRRTSMINKWFGIHEGLAAAGRIPSVAAIRERISAWEILLLLFCGSTAAAAVELVKLGLRLPGHAIVLAMIPMALGLALAPRRSAGFIMSAGAFSTAIILSQIGMVRYGTGSFVSLCLLGPILDLVLAKIRSGWRLYSGLVIAGFITNLLALTSRSAGKLLGLDLAGARPFGIWWGQAIVTYSICGAIAGLIAAICFFSLRNKRHQSEA
jgi:hypothetical protein